MRVAVIGAGAGGLVCARELLREGITPVVFEAGARIGGTWVYDEKPGQHGAMYASLRTNLPTDVMAFSDHAFEASRVFPGHAEVLGYLEGFAERFALLGHVRLRQRVQGLALDEGRFRLHVEGAREMFDAVAVCNGHYHRPVRPAFDGFTGRVTHSHDYRTPDTFVGRRVALLGAKSSGIDISGELATVADAVWLSGRDVVGSRPREGIELCPPIVSAEGSDLLLEGGGRLSRVDDLLLCTGYDYAFPFLANADIVDVEPKWVSPLWLDVVSIRAPKVAFVGLPFQVVPFPLMELQSRLFAQLLSGRVAPPSEEVMWAEHRASIAALDARGVPPRERFKYGARQFAYLENLAQRTGSAPPPASFRTRYEAASAARKADPDGYRDRPVTP